MTGFILLDRAGLWRRSLGHEAWILQIWDQARADHHESGDGWVAVRGIDPARDGVAGILADHGVKPTAVAWAVLANVPSPSGSAAR